MAVDMRDSFVKKPEMEILKLTCGHLVSMPKAGDYPSTMWCSNCRRRVKR